MRQQFYNWQMGQIVDVFMNHEAKTMNIKYDHKKGKYANQSIRAIASLIAKHYQNRLL